MLLDRESYRDQSSRQKSRASISIDLRLRSPTLADRQIATIMGLKKRDFVDQQVLKDAGSLEKMVQSAVDKSDSLQSVMSDWERIQKTMTITIEIAKRVQETFALRWIELESAVRDLALEAEAVYERYPEEADARSTENEIAKTVRRRAG